jgi:hypothetical protein
MRLWLDNARPAPAGWTLARTLDEAKRLLSSQGVERASLDHDLDGGETGMQLLEWMKETGHWPRYAPKVHSGNVEAAAKMKRHISAFCGRPPAPKPPRRSRPMSKGGSRRYAEALKRRRYE